MRRMLTEKEIKAMGGETKKYYAHNLYFAQSSGTAKIYASATIITDDDTEFTFSTLKAYLEAIGCKDDTKVANASGDVNKSNVDYIIYGMFSGTTSDVPTINFAHMMNGYRGYSGGLVEASTIKDIVVEL